ncbi:hypothetical protein L3V86_00135 [Thiotrichales bacterium 19S11-10]|nr:hypothetical protein [Thiotrichales bacterium 19S11-10]
MIYLQWTYLSPDVNYGTVLINYLLGQQYNEGKGVATIRKELGIGKTTVYTILGEYNQK